MRENPFRWRVPLAAAFLLVLCACGSSSDEPPAALNPGPPIRKAFIVSLEAGAQEISQYQLMNGDPPQGDGVQSLYSAGLRSVSAKDPWDGDVRYHGEGRHWTLSSAGPDTQWGTRDDIVFEDGRLKQ